MYIYIYILSKFMFSVYISIHYTSHTDPCQGGMTLTGDTHSFVSALLPRAKRAGRTLRSDQH